MIDCSSSNGIQSVRNDAPYPGKVTIHYPLHPFFGQSGLAVVRRYGSGKAEQFEVQGPGRRVAVPAWMTDPDRCQAMTCGFEPRCSLTSLLQLVALLDASGLSSRR